MNASCPACGAENLGTRFCESCGAPAPAPAESPVAVEVAPPAATSGWGVAFLLVFLAAHAIPPIVEIALGLSGTFDPMPARGVTTAFLVLLAIVGLGAASAGAAGPGTARAVGILAILGAAGLEIAYAFVGVSWPEPAQLVGIAAVYVLWFLGWALPAGLAPRAYAGLGVLAVAIVLQVAVPALFVLAGVWDVVAIIAATTVATVVLVLAVVGITRALHRSAPPTGPAAPPPPAESGPPHALATTALGLGLGALAAILLSILLAFAPGAGVLGAVVGLLYLGLVVGAIVTGHLARARSARTGEGGRSRAVAGMAIGYGLAGLAVVGLVVQLVSWQVTMANLSSYTAGDEYYEDEYYEDEYVDDEYVAGEGDGFEEPAAEVPEGPVCADLFSPSVVAAANSAGLVLDPAWSAGTDPGGLGLQDAELAALLDAGGPPLDCRWLTPDGGSGYGIRTTVLAVGSDEATWLSNRLAGLGYVAQNELGGTRYFFEAKSGGTAYGESHIVLDGVWFATHWLEYGPRGYTADVVTNYFR